MNSVTVRNVPEKVLAWLDERASRNERSREGELRIMLRMLSETPENVINAKMDLAEGLQRIDEAIEFLAVARKRLEKTLRKERAKTKTKPPNP